MNNRECEMPRGKVLGGSSSINYMIYNRGHKRDFDRWAESGNPGWSYNDVLPYFKKSENSNLQSAGLEDTQYHGHNGPLNVEYLNYKTDMVKSFIDALKETGLNETDYNGESQLGVSYVQATTLRGQRQSAYRTYIYPYKNRKNLHIRIYSRVTKILIDPKSKIAYGVNFVLNNKKYSVKAKNEIILSAGAFSSPQLLMLSGVGPSKHLKQMNITVIKDLPVGERMYDHVSHLGITFITNTSKQTPYASNIGLDEIYDFINGKGPLTIIGGVEALAFIKVPNSREPADYPDIELIFSAGGFASDGGTALKAGVNLRDDIYNKLYRKFEYTQKDHFTIILMLFHPKSYGNVRLANRNPFSPPILNPNFYENPDDIETMLKATKFVLKLMNTEAMRKIGVTLNNEILPGCENYLYGSDEYWKCSIRTLSDTLHHQVATCKMGPENDFTTVVNHELKVHGIKKLRVVDVSIIPYAPTAHTNAAAFMIGEKAADMIKSECIR
ncbi:glucose dehydrogenase [FAD, quinone]-like [Condylostylus longicornis]|uniref:glucose dehydrogenase [FAD, quinone]-like n=1 Tax=Condylostylus longicornis TaxID=2530218 RepID=UPI00244DC2DC|nr:glucose dehydrogenase [FAD, quinone]-like [Condylostylus longicornis]